MVTKYSRLFRTSLCVLVLALAFSGLARAESFEPALEQEFSDAKASVEDALSIKAEQFAPAFMQRAQELMKMAAGARQSKDAALFSRASRLARTYAELAKATVELRTDVGKLATAKESLDKVKTEIEDLKKAP